MNQTSTPWKAVCACAGASITLTGQPKMHGVCHCTNCKRRTGSAFGFSSYFLKTDVAGLEGETATWEFHNASQKHDQKRHFCARCGTTLFWYRSDAPGLIGIATGCLAGSGLPEPRFSASHSSRESWLNVPTTWKEVAGQ